MYLTIKIRIYLIYIINKIHQLFKESEEKFLVATRDCFSLSKPGSSTHDYRD